MLMASTFNTVQLERRDFDCVDKEILLCEKLIITKYISK